MTTAPAIRDLRDLKDDRRGAVLLIAVFMSAFLCGTLWYIIGIGDAAIYRQYMQDGADAVAFGSAVYHARGMNIIALINLVMAAVLMVLVAFKIGQLLLAIANIASCLAGAWLNPICDLTTAAKPPYDNLVSAVEKIVDKILRVLYQASNVVAYGMPWVAEGKALMVAQQYKPTVDGGFMVSISLVPGALEQSLGGFVAKDPKPKGEDTGAATATGETKKDTSGQRYGLPVQDDEFKELCKRAAKNVTHLVFMPFKMLPGFGALAGGVEKFAGGMVSAVVGFFPGYFCGDGGGSSAASSKSFSDKMKEKLTGDSKSKIKDLCDKRQKDALETNIKNKKAGLPPVDFDYKKCLEATDKSFSAIEKPAAGSTSGDGKTSKKVYDPATLGDDYFAIWGFGFGNLQDQTGADKGVNIAGWNKAKVAPPSMFSKIGIAKAEFYYEPKSDDPKKWDELKEDAMWNMRWRARLRRLRLPIPAAGAILATKINSKIPEIPFMSDILTAPASGLGKIIDEGISTAVDSLTSTIIAH